MGNASWVRPVVLAASCLILGFVAGWSLATIGGDEISLPEASVDVTVEQPAPKTTTVTPTSPPPEPAPARDQIAVAVLNGTSIPGRAAETAKQMTGLGYGTVTTGNATGQLGPTVVYYREGAKAAGDQVAKDLQASSVEPIDGSPVAGQAPAAAQVVVVLGST